MIQCSLLGIPAIITHGNSLTLETWEEWETPFVGINLVKERLRAQNKCGVQAKTESLVKNMSEKVQRKNNSKSLKQLTFNF